MIKEKKVLLNEQKEVIVLDKLFLAVGNVDGRNITNNITENIRLWNKIDESDVHKDDYALVEGVLSKLKDKKLVENSDGGWAITEKGKTEYLNKVVELFRKVSFSINRDNHEEYILEERQNMILTQQDMSNLISLLEDNNLLDEFEEDPDVYDLGPFEN